MKKLNKLQAKIAWWGLILLSGASAVTGLAWYDSMRYSDENLAVPVVFCGVIPIILLFGFGIIRAGQKSDDGDK